MREDGTDESPLQGMNNRNRTSSGIPTDKLKKIRINRKDFKKGGFVIKDLEWGKTQARRLKWIGEFFQYYKKRNFISAMLSCYQNKTFKWEIFKKRLENNSSKLKNQGSRNDFIVNIERIYNIGTADKNKIRLDLYDYKR